MIADLHVNSNGSGISYIAGLGDYSGGELWMYDPTGKDTARVTGPVKGAAWLKVAFEHA